MRSNICFANKCVQFTVQAVCVEMFVQHACQHEGCQHLARSGQGYSPWACHLLDRPAYSQDSCGNAVEHQSATL